MTHWRDVVRNPVQQGRRTVTTLRIYDLTGDVLAVDLWDLLRLMAPQSLQSNWTISTVKSSIPGHGWFEATGKNGKQLERLAQQNARLSGSDLAALARDVRQLVWGEFVGSLPAEEDGNWVIIRAADSTFSRSKRKTRRC